MAHDDFFKASYSLSVNFCLVHRSLIQWNLTAALELL